MMFSKKLWNQSISKTFLLEIMNAQFRYFARERHNEITEDNFNRLFGKKARLSREMVVFENEKGEVVGFTALSNFLERKFWRLVIAILPEYFSTSLPLLVIKAGISLGKELGVKSIEFYTTGPWTAPFDRVLEDLGFPPAYFLLKLRLTNWQEEQDPEIPQEVSISLLDEPDDFDQFNSVECDAFRSVTAYQPTTAEKVKERIDFRRKLRDLDFFLAYVSRKLIGFCYIEYDPKESIGEIQSLAVHSYYQHRGIGKYLLVQGIKQLQSKNCKNIELTALYDNKNAINLYQSLGFQLDENRTSKCYRLTL